MSPANGTVSFLATADDWFRFTVDGKTIMDTISADVDESTSMLTGEVEMVQVSQRREGVLASRCLNHRHGGALFFVCFFFELKFIEADAGLTDMSDEKEGNGFVKLVHFQASK